MYSLASENQRVGDRLAFVESKRLAPLVQTKLSNESVADDCDRHNTGEDERNRLIRRQVRFLSVACLAGHRVIERVTFSAA